jgi:peptide/nickel transport system permease protein
MKRVLLITTLRFFVTIGITCLLMWMLLSLWPNLQSSGYSTSDELKFIFIHGGRSLLLISLALLFSLAFTGCALIFSLRFHQPRFISVGIKSGFYILSAIPALFVGYLVLEFFNKNLGHDLFVASQSQAGQLKYYLLPAFVLGVGDGFLNELIQHAEEEVNAIRRENYVRMAKGMGGSLWKYIWRDLIVRSSRVIFSRLTMLISGTVVIEFVFGIPGLGDLVFNAAERRYALRLMLVLFCIVIVVSFLNLMYRIMAVVMDARLR